jgi:hypothetical protein
MFFTVIGSCLYILGGGRGPPRAVVIFSLLNLDEEKVDFLTVPRSDSGFLSTIVEPSCKKEGDKNERRTSEKENRGGEVQGSRWCTCSMHRGTSPPPPYPRTLPIRPGDSGESPPLPPPPICNYCSFQRLQSIFPTPFRRRS